MSESHGDAWNRVYYFRQLFKPKKKGGRPVGNSWMRAEECPIRLRGYTEIVMGDVDSALRKKIDATFRRGYQLEKNTQLPWIMRALEKHNPVQAIRIGYLGRTKFTMYMPTLDMAKDLQEELQAMTVMTDAIPVQAIHLHGMRVTCDVPARDGVTGDMKHLRAAFTELRPVIDSHMELWAKEREAVARWCFNDDAVIRIPFDTHLNKDKANAK